MVKDFIIAALIVSTLTLATSIPLAIRYKNKLIPNQSEYFTKKSLKSYTNELEVTISEASTTIIQYFDFQNLNPKYTSKNISPSLSHIPFHNIPVKKCYTVKTSMNPHIQTVFVDKENLDILYDYLYADLIKSKPAIKNELDQMYLNNKPIKSSDMLRKFVEKYSLFNEIKSYKKLNNDIYGALIMQYGDDKQEGKYRYSHEFFLKED